MEKVWRISKKDYLKRAKEIVKANESVQEWADLSLDPTLDNTERMIRVIMNNDPGVPKKSYICQSYMCSVMTANEEFLKDLIYVNSSLSIPCLWDDEIIDWVCTAYSNYIEAFRTGTTAYTGNACEYVEAAVKDGRFAKTHPEYHAFLAEKLVDKEILADKILKYKGGKKDTIERAIEYYKNAYELTKKYTNYQVPVTNLLDWKAINTKVLNPVFVYKYKKVGGGQGEEKPDDPIVKKIDAKIYKKKRSAF